MDVIKNRNAVKDVNLDISKEKLEKTFNKTIDDGYLESPTNDKYVVTQEKPRGKATFPLILILSQLETEAFRVSLIKSLKQIPQIGETVTVMYRRGGKAISLCTTYANKETMLMLKSFCLDFKFFVNVGVEKKDLEFDELLNLDTIGKNIVINEDNIQEYSPTVEDDVVSNIDCSKYIKEINRILMKGQSRNSIELLINPKTETEENRKNEDNFHVEIIPEPVSEEAIAPKEDNETEDLKVKSW